VKIKIIKMVMAAKLIGAGLATIALAGAAIGVGLIFAAYQPNLFSYLGFDSIPLSRTIGSELSLLTTYYRMFNRGLI
jgi:hypothetical protein